MDTQAHGSLESERYSDLDVDPTAITAALGSGGRKTAVSLRSPGLHPKFGPVWTTDSKHRTEGLDDDLVGKNTCYDLNSKP